jgi:hypothetical protein
VKKLQTLSPQILHAEVVGRSPVRATEMAGRVLVRNRAPANWPRESVEDGNDQLDGDQTLDILLGFAMVHVSIQG